MERYVLGFLLDPERVVLIRKTHPEWQRGRLNGIGGKIEEGEDSFVAMEREFHEEAGAWIDHWTCFGMLRNVQLGYEVELFFALVEDVRPLVSRQTDEIVTVKELAQLERDVSVIPNVRWMIEMARSMHRGERAFRFVIEEEH